MVVDLTNAPIQGLSDLLRKITFCTAVGGLRNDRTLYIRQEYTAFSPYSFLDLCDIKGFNLKPWDTSLGPAEFKMAANALPFDLGGVKTYKPGDLTISDEEFLGLWARSYRLVCPKPHIKLRIDSLQVDEKCVGLHVRRTDKISKNPDHWQVHEQRVFFLERKSRRAISSVLSEHKTRKIFLACDNEQSKLYWTRQLAKKKYTVIANNALFDSSKFRQTSGEDFIVDLFALAQCGVIVMTLSSGVAEAAARINGKTKLVYAQQHSFIRRHPFLYRLAKKVRHTIMVILR